VRQPPTPRGATSRQDSGFTLIELLVAVALMAVAGTLGLTTLVNYQRAQDVQQSADALVSALRKAGQKAVSEGRSYCVALDGAADTWRTYQRACAGADSQPVGSAVGPEGRVRLGTLTVDSTTGPTCPTGTCITFRPRGTATAASLTVQLDGYDPVTVTVEGLTGRVDRT
jgi:type II secretion system protein H